MHFISHLCTVLRYNGVTFVTASHLWILNPRYGSRFIDQGSHNLSRGLHESRLRPIRRLIFIQIGQQCDLYIRNKLLRSKEDFLKFIKQVFQAESMASTLRRC